MSEGCTHQAISEFDDEGNIISAPGWCLEHHPKPALALAKMKHHIETHNKIVGLCANGITADGIDLANKRFYGCSLQHCTFRNIHSHFFRTRMCMFDFCTITDCDFLESNIQFSSFSGSKMAHVLFTGSDLIHNNFNGITAYQSSFDDSDLYNSRFIKAVLINTSLSNCNLKKTVFYDSIRDAVSFRLSNMRESLLDRNKGGMMGDFTVKFDDEGIT